MSILRPCWPLLAMPVLLAVAAAPPAESDALEHNRLLLEKWRRDDPEHVTRLRHDLRAFWEMPPQRREAMRRLDRDLHALDRTEQKRLWRALVRYSVWLDHLHERSPADYARIEAAADPAERLRVIREVRERQWVERLPQKVREALLKLPEAERPARIAQLRDEERQHRRLWMRPQRHAPARGGKVARLADFPRDVQDFVRNRLTPTLSKEEARQLKRAEGKWPDYPQLLLRLAHRHRLIGNGMDPPGPPELWEAVKKPL